MRKIFQSWLFLFVVLACAVTFFISFMVQSYQARQNAENMLHITINDVRSQLAVNREKVTILQEIMTKAVQMKLHYLNAMLDADPQLQNDRQKLLRAKKMLDVDELHITDQNGVIRWSTAPDIVNYDMKRASQSREFLPVLEDKKFVLIQKPMPRGIDNIWFQYAGCARTTGPGLIQIGYEVERLVLAQKLTDLRSFTSSFRIGDNGRLLIADNRLVIVNTNNNNMLNTPIATLGISRADVKSGEPFIITHDKENYICMAEKIGDLHLIGMLPYKEMYVNRDSMITFLIICNLVLFGVVFVLVSELVQKVVISGIQKINASLRKITDGDLDEKISVYNNPEFTELSNGINKTVEALKHHIDAAAARIDEELNFARSIQLSALPNVFPPFPARHEFELHAGMFTAKEVGGDFYDFFLVAEDQLAIVIADVSGKGIGAALFMMRAKTTIKSLAVSGLPPSEILTRANRELCTSNSAGMFVTVFLAILDISAGMLRYANAGHNPPLFFDARRDSWEFLPVTPNLVLAGIDAVRYNEQQLPMSPGDRLFLFTDGITEAHNIHKALFGDDNLRDLLNSATAKSATPGELTTLIKHEVDLFTGNAEQFDDITMLTLQYNGLTDNSGELTVPAEQSRLPEILSFVENAASGIDCSDKCRMQLQLAVEEIFINIVNYAYQPGRGPATIRCRISDNPLQIEIQFIDGGIPYNPLNNADLDLGTPAAVRETGGLGIFLVRKTMDSLDYRYEDGKNILTVKKNF